jgi:hypothetical protein
MVNKMVVGDVSKFEVEGYGEAAVIMCNNGVRFVLSNAAIRVELKIIVEEGGSYFADKTDSCFFDKSDGD